MGVYCMHSAGDVYVWLHIPPSLLWLRGFLTLTSVSVLISSLGEVSEMALVEEELPGVSKGESFSVELAKRCRLSKHACKLYYCSQVLLSMNMLTF